MVSCRWKVCEQISQQRMSHTCGAVDQAVGVCRSQRQVRATAISRNTSRLQSAKGSLAHYRACSRLKRRPNRQVQLASTMQAQPSLLPCRKHDPINDQGHRPQKCKLWWLWPVQVLLKAEVSQDQHRSQSNERHQRWEPPGPLQSVADVGVEVAMQLCGDDARVI